MKILSLTLSAALVVGLLSSCKKKTYETEEGTYESTPKTTTFTGNDGTKATMGDGNVSLPDDFPEDIPIVEGAKIFMTTKSPKGHLVNLRSTKPPAEIKTFYGEKMKAEGWEQSSAMELPNGGMFTYTKDGRNAHLVIAGSESETTVNITAN